MARPQSFDRDEALKQAMHVFWEQGYEGTSLHDLMDAMDLRKGSIYNTFGDKQSLFAEALESYSQQINAAMKAILTKAPSPYKGLHFLLTRALPDFATDKEKRRGCMIANTLAETDKLDPRIKAILEERNARAVAMITGVVEEGQTKGEFRTDVSAADLARQINLTISGVMIDSKGGRPKEETSRMMESFMALLKP